MHIKRKCRRSVARPPQQASKARQRSALSSSCCVPERAVPDQSRAILAVIFQGSAAIGQRDLMVRTPTVANWKHKQTSMISRPEHLVKVPQRRLFARMEGTQTPVERCHSCHGNSSLVLAGCVHERLFCSRGRCSASINTSKVLWPKCICDLKAQMQALPSASLSRSHKIVGLD